MRLLSIVLLAGLFSTAAAPAVEVVRTIAGSGSKTDYTDGVALNKSLFFPSGVVIDASGVVYFCESEGNKVKKLDLLGNLTTIAGTGVAGYSGDNAAATSATLRRPQSVCVNMAGDVYIADTGNNVIRKVSGGIITTVVGDGYISNCGAGRYNGDGSALTQSLNRPCGVFESSGDLYIADTDNHLIRKVVGGTISTLAGVAGTPGNTGDGSFASMATLKSPTSVLFDGLYVYICDSGNNRIREIDSGGYMNHFAGDAAGGSGFADGDGSTARFNEPTAIAFDGSSTFYVTDSNNHAIRSVTFVAVATVAGPPPPATSSQGFSGDGGLATAAKMNEPGGIAVLGSTVVFADRQNNRIRKFPVGGNIATLAGNGSGDFGSTGPGATNSALAQPQSVWADAAGNTYVCDSGNHMVFKFDSAGSVTAIAGTGVAGFSGDGGAGNVAKLAHPEGVFVDGLGNVYISDSGNARIRRVRVADGIIETVCGNGNQGSTGDGGAATAAQIDGPGALAGNLAGDIIFIEQTSGRIRKFQTGGNISAFAGNGVDGFGGDGGPATAASFCEPTGLAFEPVSGNYFVAEMGGNRIRKITSAGIISTVAGTGTPGSSGDGGLATAAQLNAPTGILAFPDGQLLISEIGSHKIRNVDAAGKIKTVAGTGVPGYSGAGPTLATSATFAAPYAIAGATTGVVVSDLGNNRIRLLYINQPPTAFIDATVGADSVSSALLGTAVTYTATATDPNGDTPLTYSWNMGDGTTLTGNPVTHTHATEGAFSVALTVSDPFENGAPKTFAFSTLAPNSGSGNEPGASEGTATSNPLDGLTISVTDTTGGVYTLYIDVNSLTREAYDVSTNFESINGRAGSSSGTRPQNKFTSAEVFVAETTATETATATEAGKGRKTLVVSSKEVGDTTALVDNRSSKDLTLTSLKGKFIFKDNNTADAKNDTVTFSGTFRLPGGLDTTQSYELWVGIGNIVDTITIGPKGKAVFPSQMGRLKKVAIKYPKLANAPIADGDETAKISFSISAADMDVNGFDTEGVSAEVTGADKTAVERQIQLGLLLGGIAYQSSATVEFKTSPKIDKTTSLPESGQINGRR
jgi:hypothetical protein